MMLSLHSSRGRAMGLWVRFH